MDNHKLFYGVEWELTHYNGKGVDQQITFYQEDGTTSFDFSALGAIIIEIYDEREGRLLFSFSDADYISVTGNIVLLTIPYSAITFSDLGNYYYHLYWTVSGGYDNTLMYGTFKVI